MTRTIHIIFILSFHLLLSAQNVNPIELEFLNNEPEWTFISIDSNMIDTILEFATPYNKHHSINSFAHDGFFYIHEGIRSPSPYIGPDGMLLYKLDISTGEAIWCINQSSLAGSTHRIMYNYSLNISEYIKDDKIELIGTRSFEEIDKTRPCIYYYANPFKQVIDLNDGKIIETKVGHESQNDIYSYAGVLYKHLFTSNKERKFYSWFDIDEPFEEYFEFVSIDEDLKIDRSSSTKIYYDEVENNSRSLEFLGFNIFPLQEDTLVTLVGTEWGTNGHTTPSHLSFKWLDLSDPDTVIVYKQKDITDEIPKLYQLAEKNRKFKKLDDNLLIYQTSFDKFDEDGPEIYSWLSWYDIEGDLMNHIPLIVNESRGYKFMHPITVRGNDLYMAISFEYEDKLGYDILKINKIESSYEIIDSIVIDNSTAGMEYLQHVNTNVTDDNKMLMHAFTDVQHPDIRYNYFKFYFCFDLTKMGVPLPITEPEPVVKIPEVKIFPNPTNDKIFISSPDHYDNYWLYSKLGVLLKKGNLIEEEIEVSDLAAGAYTIVVGNDRSNVVRKFIKI